MDKGQRSAPLYESLLLHRSRKAVSCHVPGHKQGAAVDEEAAADYKAILSLDQTEIPGLDDLHHPEEAILHAQQLAAHAFGAEQTWFLAGGSTAGNMAMVLSVCGPGDLLLVQRDAHKSVIHALMLAGARAVFLMPEVDTAAGLSLGVSLQTVQQSLERYPEARGLLVTNPSYYGIVRELAPLAALLHRQGKLLLVDEAHGAHLGFHPALPPSAMAAGADAAVQSTHKMLTSMTMSAMLHVQGSRMPRDAVSRVLSMLQSSSPSYPLLASLDLARRQAAFEGAKLFEEPLASVLWLKQQMAKLKRLAVRSREQERAEGELKIAEDPLKVLVYDRLGQLGGSEIKAQLEERGCYPELADARQVLLAFGPGSRMTDAVRIAEALNDMESRLPAEYHDGMRLSAADEPVKGGLGEEQQISVPVAFGLEQSLRPKRITHVPLKHCAGARAAELIIPYPPGIPVLYPGELITEACVRSLARLTEAGVRFHGYDVGRQGMLPVLQDNP